MRLLLAPLLAAALPAQLTTTFLSNNGGTAGGAVYFTLTCTDPAGVTITSLDLNFSASSTVGDVEIWLKCLDSLPHTAPDWTLVDTAFAVAAVGVDLPTPVALTSGVQLDAFCSYGMALVNSSTLAHRYTSGSPPVALQYTAPGLVLDAGEASNAPFVGPAFTPRVVNTNIYYLSGSGGGNLACACALPQGSGCGPAPFVPLQLAPVNTAVQSAAGPTTVTATTQNIPAGAFLHLGIVGLSRPGVPLGGVGMPGCFLNASLDLIHADFGFVPPTHTWVVLVVPPLPPVLSGVQFNAQAAVLGTVANPFLGAGGLTSNGVKYTIGTL
jgi:predicted outer membrane repeat protein